MRDEEHELLCDEYQQEHQTENKTDLCFSNNQTAERRTSTKQILLVLIVMSFSFVLASYRYLYEMKRMKSRHEIYKMSLTHSGKLKLDTEFKDESKEAKENYIQSNTMLVHYHKTGK